tara:strand:+ start:1546 stop:3540 length:1995 start_codon:yes stop_codon:yes gene_type:complete
MLKAPDHIRHLSSAYATLIIVILSLVPAFGSAYLYFFQDSHLRFISHTGHEVAIAIALLQSGFIAAIAWRCFQYSGEQFVRWLALGFFAFTLIYACHGIFTRIGSVNIWQFVLYGPVSRLAMVICFFVGLLTYGEPAVDNDKRQRQGSWLIWTIGLLIINAAVFSLASTSWAPHAQKILELCALLLSLLCIVIVHWRGLSSPLMTIYSVSLLFFAQSSATFLLSSAWNHLWWFAHIIFASGFILLSYGVIKVFLTTQSFALVFSQEELFEQVRAERNRAENALVELQNAYTELGNTHDLLHSVLASASEFSIIATDTRGVITIFNAGSERMLGYRAADMVGLQTPSILHCNAEIEARSKELSAEFDTEITGFRVLTEKSEVDGQETREWTYIHKDGHRFPVSLVVTTIRSATGEITGYLGIAENITEQKRLANSKSEFISTVSHELRTPLTSIIGCLDLIAGGAFGPVSESMSQMVDVASKNSQRLRILIDDLLDTDKMNNGKLNFELVWQPLEAIVEQAIEDIRPYGSKRHISLIFKSTIASELQVRVDAMRLQQVLGNLISNAIKFSPEDDVVEIIIKRIDGKARVEVSDHGSGIPWAFRASIFQRFSQADSSDTRQHGGSGLGLAITHQLVEHMGGSIGFESEPGNGTVFWFELPLQQSAD